MSIGGEETGCITDAGERRYPTNLTIKNPDGSVADIPTKELLELLNKCQKETFVELYGQALEVNPGSLVGKIMSRVRDLLDDAPIEAGSISSEEAKIVNIIRIPQIGERKFDSLEIRWNKNRETGHESCEIHVMHDNEREPVWIDLDDYEYPLTVNNGIGGDNAQPIFVKRVLASIGREADAKIFEQATRPASASELREKGFEYDGPREVGLFPSLYDERFFMETRNSTPEIDAGHPVAEKEHQLIEKIWTFLDPADKKSFVDIPPSTRVWDDPPKVWHSSGGLYEEQLRGQLERNGRFTDTEPPRDFSGSIWLNPTNHQIT